MMIAVFFSIKTPSLLPFVYKVEKSPRPVARERFPLKKIIAFSAAKVKRRPPFRKIRRSSFFPGALSGQTKSPTGKAGDTYPNQTGTLSFASAS